MKVELMKKDYLVVFAMTALVGGCTSAGKPVLIEHADAATIRVLNLSSRPLHVMEARASDCSDLNWFGGIPGKTPAADTRLTKAEPGKLFTFYVKGKIPALASSGQPDSSMVSCEYSIGFVPEPKGVYEITYGYPGQGCQTAVHQFTGAEWVSTPKNKMNLNTKVSPPYCVSSIELQ